MQHDRNLSIDETRRVLAAEHFLQPHSQDWQIWRVVLNANIRSAWDRQMRGCPPFELA